MQAVTPMTLHMDSPMTLERVYAKQNDKFSRYILADLFSGAFAWAPPDDAAAIIRYRKPDGTSGFYDVDEAGRPAVTRDGSSVKLYLAEQVLTVPGVVPMELNFYSPDGGKLTSFAWDLIVKPSVVPDDAIQSTDYYNGLTATIAQAVKAASDAAASARAAAASAEALAKYIGQDGAFTVPGELDANGNINVKGRSYLDGGITVTGDSYFTGNVNTDGTINGYQIQDLSKKLGQGIWRETSSGSGAIAAGQSVSLTLQANSCYLVFIWSHATGPVFSAHLVTTYAGTNNKAASIIGSDYSTVSSSEQTVTMTGTSFSWNYTVVQL